MITDRHVTQFTICSGPVWMQQRWPGGSTTLPWYSSMLGRSCFLEPWESFETQNASYHPFLGLELPPDEITTRSKASDPPPSDRPLMLTGSLHKPTSISGCGPTVYALCICFNPRTEIYTYVPQFSLKGGWVSRAQPAPYRVTSSKDPCFPCRAVRYLAPGPSEDFHIIRFFESFAIWLTNPSINQLAPWTFRTQFQAIMQTAARSPA